MSILLLVMTDGRRDYLERTLASFDARVTGPVTRRIIHDDSGDRDYSAWLGEAFPGYGLIGGARAGFGGAIDRAWRVIATCPERFVFHLEDDFEFVQPLDLTDLAHVLDLAPYLVQLALRRQPWNAEERAAGGIVELCPGDYVEATIPGGAWLEHRRFFTTNPSLYRRELCTRGWPSGRDSEGRFSRDLFVDATARAGFWGARDSGEWVHHIGHQRAGTGY